MNELEKYTIQELEQEIERKKRNEIPKPLNNIDYEPLVNLVNDIIEKWNLGIRVKDYEQYIYEEAITCILGEDAFNWINENQQDC